MKKFISIILLAAMCLTLTACSNTEEQKPQGADLSGLSLEEIINKIYEAKPTELPLMSMPVDTADADALAAYTGLSDASLVKEAMFSESMIGSQAYSLVLVRVNDAAKAGEVAQTMLDNINPAKWICVEADDIDAAVYGDLVMFMMINSDLGSEIGGAADYVAAFKTVCGGVLDKELSK